MSLHALPTHWVKKQGNDSSSKSSDCICGWVKGLRSRSNRVSFLACLARPWPASSSTVQQENNISICGEVYNYGTATSWTNYWIQRTCCGCFYTLSLSSFREWSHMVVCAPQCNTVRNRIHRIRTPSHQSPTHYLRIRLGVVNEGFHQFCFSWNYLMHSFGKSRLYDIRHDAFRIQNRIVFYYAYQVKLYLLQNRVIIGGRYIWG